MRSDWDRAREQRRMTHDVQQAHRRTRAQNEALIKTVQANGPPDSQWTISDIPEEGGDFEVGRLDTGQKWVIDCDGGVKDIRDA